MKKIIISLALVGLFGCATHKPSKTVVQEKKNHKGKVKKVTTVTYY